MRDRLEQLVGEMVDKGIRYEDAQREFEKRFITRVLRSATATSARPPTTLGIHRNTLTRKIQELKIKGCADAARAPPP